MTPSSLTFTHATLTITIISNGYPLVSGAWATSFDRGGNRASTQSKYSGRSNKIFNILLCILSIRSWTDGVVIRSFLPISTKLKPFTAYNHNTLRLFLLSRGITNRSIATICRLFSFSSIISKGVIPSILVYWSIRVLSSQMASSISSSRADNLSS